MAPPIVVIAAPSAAKRMLDSSPLRSYVEPSRTGRNGTARRRIDALSECDGRKGGRGADPDARRSRRRDRVRSGIAVGPPPPRIGGQRPADGARVMAQTMQTGRRRT